MAWWATELMSKNTDLVGVKEEKREIFFSLAAPHVSPPSLRLRLGLLKTKQHL